MKSWFTLFFGRVYVECVDTSQYGGCSQDNSACFNNVGIGRGRNKKHMYHRCLLVVCRFESYAILTRICFKYILSKRNNFVLTCFKFMN